MSTIHLVTFKQLDINNNIRKIEVITFNANDAYLTLKITFNANDTNLTLNTSSIRSISNITIRVKKISIYQQKLVSSFSHSRKNNNRSLLRKTQNKSSNFHHPLRRRNRRTTKFHHTCITLLYPSFISFFLNHTPPILNHVLLQHIARDLHRRFFRKFVTE